MTASSVTVADATVAPTYAVAASGNISEGGTETFTVTTTGLAAGTQLAYQVTGTGNAAGNTATGLVTIDSSGKGLVSVAVPANATLGDSGTLQFSLVNGKATSSAVTVADATVVPTYAVSASGTVSEGGTEIFTVTTTGVAAGTQLAYQVTGTGNAAGNTSTGVLTIDSSGKGYVSVAAPSNSVVGDSGTLQFALLNGKGSTSAINVVDATATSYSITDVANVNLTTGQITITETGATAQSISVDQTAASLTNGLLVSAGSTPTSVTVKGNNAAVVTLVGTGTNTITTGDGADTIIVSGTGSTTINVGKGADHVTAGSGSDNIVFASGNLGAGDVVDGGAGIDTVTLAGVDNVVGGLGAVLTSVENLVLTGTELTITGSDIAALKSVQGSAATSQLTVTGAAGSTVDLSGVSLNGINKITVDAATAGTITLKMSADQIAQVGSFAAATGDKVGISTDAAGLAAIGSKAP